MAGIFLANMPPLPEPEPQQPTTLLDLLRQHSPYWDSTYGGGYIACTCQSPVSDYSAHLNALLSRIVLAFPT